MLVLSRHRNESLILSGGIKIMVVQIQGDKVRIGIEAPNSVEIHREEIWKKKYGLPSESSQGSLPTPASSDECSPGQTTTENG